MYNTTHALEIVLRKTRELKMNVQSQHRQINAVAKQVGFMPSYWLAINSLSNDRTPLEGLSPGSEGAGYA